MALSLYLGTLMLPLERKYTSNDQSRETTLSHDSSDDAGRLTLKTNYYLETSSCSMLRMRLEVFDLIEQFKVL